MEPARQRHAERAAHTQLRRRDRCQCFEDKKGQEQVWLHAERNQDIEVEHDETHWVGNDRSKTIDHDETVHVKHDRTETVDHDETITVHNNRTETVDGDETITISPDAVEDAIERHGEDHDDNRPDHCRGRATVRTPEGGAR